MIRFYIRQAACVVVAFVLSSSLALGQEVLQHGDLSFSRAPAPHLRAPVTRGAAFFRRVGGVAFEAVAKGKDGLVVEKLTYHQDSPDGSRLVVTVKTPEGETKDLRTNIYDWELVPIANFANYRTGSAMTLFGSLEDEKAQRRLRDAGGQAINYHRTLDNTLVGLRMMQADILLFQPSAAELPKRPGGSYVLGAGEHAPNVAENRRRFETVNRLLVEERARGNMYRSYVVGDLNQAVMFSDRNGRLVFAGTPFWMMWSYAPEVEKALEDIRLLDGARQQDVNSMLALQSRYPTEAALVARFKEIDVILTQWQSRGEPIVMNHGLSRRVSRVVAELDGVNPVVYAALKKVMHYRALFRHYKARDREGYLAFLRSLQHIRVQPAVQTPTVQQYASTR